MTAVDPARLQRALWLEHQLIEPGRFLVYGGQDDHLVELDGEVSSCDCADALYNDEVCKHELCIRLQRGDRQVLRALRRLVPPPPVRSLRDTNPVGVRNSPPTLGCPTPVMRV